LVTIIKPLLLLTLLSSISCSNKHLLNDETVIDLFGKDVKCVLLAKHDLGGIDFHGGEFTFYEYQISSMEIKSLITTNNLLEFPLFKKGNFKREGTSEVLHGSKWKRMPIESITDSVLYRGSFQFTNVQELKVGDSYLKEMALTDSSNYYVGLLSRQLGLIFMIISPDSGKLYLVNKRG
jgi:hypothetical protein